MLDLEFLSDSAADTRCGACPIRHRAVCSRCGDDELAELDKIKFYKSYSAGQTISLRDEPLNVLSSVVTGTAILSKTLEDGRTQMLGLMLPSDFIGRPGRETHAHDVTAVTDVTLCCFHRRPFEALMIRFPHLPERLLEMALDDLDAARDWMLLLGRKTAREKIASFLMLLVNRSQPTDGTTQPDQIRLELPVSREVMATYLGLTIETVSRQFTALRKSGVIEIEGTRIVHVPDLARLQDETAED